ncbi:MAG TPA: hypothetical protein VFW65_00540 [Pseudonocardiaceae bacterium]|nr:hypothetical protein [Pseudonocardiaceae bacterium]
MRTDLVPMKPQTQRERPRARLVAATTEPPRLAQAILSIYIGRSLDISDMLGSSIAAVPRAENRDGSYSNRCRSFGSCQVK